MLSSVTRKLYQWWIYCIKINIVIFNNVKVKKKRNPRESIVFILMYIVLRIKYFYFNLYLRVKSFRVTLRELGGEVYI